MLLFIYILSMHFLTCSIFALSLSLSALALVIAALTALNRNSCTMNTISNALLKGILPGRRNQHKTQTHTHSNSFQPRKKRSTKFSADAFKKRSEITKSNFINNKKARKKNNNEKNNWRLNSAIATKIAFYFHFNVVMYMHPYLL